jgi:hypothetical protein
MKAIYHNVEFEFIKNNYGWIAETTKYHLVSANGNTRKECAQNLKEKCENTKPEDLLEMIEYARKRKIKRRMFEDTRIVEMFYNIFGFNLKNVTDFLCYGIDVIKLDKILKVPDGISTNDFITQKYGEKATKLVKHLI